MKNKIVIITGGSTGIGKVTATELARQGAQVVLVSRDAARGNAAMTEIIKETRNQQVTFIPCDLSRMANVKILALEIQSRFNHIDVLINNAGILPGKFTLTPEGYELSWATNYLSGFLLTNLLWQQLLNAEAARIINVSSEAHRLGQIDVNQTHTVKNYSSFTAYCDSKLANILFTYELAQRLELTSITANCLHPGVIASNFGTTSFGLLKWIFRLGRPFMQSAAKGAETVIYLATSPEVTGVTGKYFKKKKPVKSSKETYNTALAKRLWRFSAAQTGLYVGHEDEEEILT
ncbi:SDR family oxidoreductase [Adhaeribacter rhizoryzae]|uniref:SDR family oxidoreductase n=1 Tax=Adhaeribacter rhizoryzae TaxID=2607907 RepID=A0A5M6DP04_9BACT|nr:SDR family oxidoreductase [Adhaeribacter rhizoryzae]KAA5547972.1 SDR family oxidoreductase [Adhaeribacter rhizoryzae]